MPWRLAVDPSAQKQLRRFPHKDAERIRLALQTLEHDPFSGDAQKMQGEDSVWRRRIGSYRIKYDRTYAFGVIPMKIGIQSTASSPGFQLSLE